MPTPEPNTLHRAWPTCAVCGTPVFEMTSIRDVLRCETVFTARCHGATETIAVPDVVLVHASGGLRPGVAFAEQPALSEGDPC